MIRILRHIAPVVCLASGLAGGMLHGQTIVLSPTGYIALGPGDKQQYKAVVTGDSNMGATVIWSAGGKVGGNSTVGTISSTGLYTAPVTLPPDQVQITATWSGNSKISASTYIDVLPTGPTITAVSPNPPFR